MSSWGKDVNVYLVVTKNIHHGSVSQQLKNIWYGDSHWVAVVKPFYSFEKITRRGYLLRQHLKAAPLFEKPRVCLVLDAHSKLNNSAPSAYHGKGVRRPPAKF